MPDYVNATIHFSKAISSVSNSQNHLFGLNGSQMKVHNLLHSHSGYTIKDWVHESEPNDGHVRIILTELKSRDIIQRIGSNRTG